MAVLGACSREPVPVEGQVTPCQEHECTTEHSFGYGQVWVSGKHYDAHRIAFAMGHGIDPAGKIVRHSCDNPRCVNPEHLSIGTHGDNMRDMVERGRSLRGERNPNSSLSDTDVRGIRCLLCLGCTGREVARALGISTALVSLIKNGKRWS